MNFGEEVYNVVKSFRQFDVTVKSASSKSTTLIVKGPDRATMQGKIEKALMKSRIPKNKITREKVGASSFPATVVNLTNDKMVILYKPVRKGADRGALQTRNVESAQCLYAALAFRSLGRKIKETDVSVSNFEKCKLFIDVDAKFEDMVNIADDWVASSIKGANELYSKVSKNVKWTFHRGSQKVNLIESKFKELNRKEKLFSNINKWSPADFYLVGSSMGETDWKSIKDVTTIKGLNQLMIQFIDENKLMGVSLKKIAQNAKPFKFYNLTKDRNAGDVGATNTIIFESVVSNEGNDYDNTTGIYTAPVNGLYWFSNTFLSTTANDTDVEIRIDNVSGSSAFGKHRVNTDANHASSSWSGVTYLNAGQNVRCVVTNNTVHGGSSRWTVFTGYLIR